MAEGVPYSRLVQGIGEEYDEGLLSSIAAAAAEEVSNGTDEAPESSQRTGLLWSKHPNATDDQTTDSTPPLDASPNRCTPTSSALSRDVSMVVRVFFLRGFFVDRRWVFPLLLACSAGCYEAAAATILNVISDFYVAITSMDATLFLRVWPAFVGA